MLFVKVFTKCAEWTDSLFDAVGGTGIVMAAFLIVLVIGLLFAPMRGNAMTNIKAYGENKIHAKKVDAKHEARRQAYAAARKKGG